MIYLDNAGTTEIDPDVFCAMEQYLCGPYYGNPGSLCSFGTASMNAIDAARKHVAEFVGADPENIIFTSGSTESNNSVVHHMCKYAMENEKKFIVTSSIEHDSIIEAVNNWGDGLDVIAIKPNSHGVITADSVDAVVSTISENVAFVSIMHTNNETGVRNEVEGIGEVCNRYHIQFHTDCTQAAGCDRLDVDKLHCDFLSISSHKIHGPKGVGALYVRHPSIFTPLIYGGHYQEFGLRSGTENVAGIVGFGCACDLINHNFDKYVSNIKHLRETFVNALSEHLVNGKYYRINSNAGKVVNVMFYGVDGESLLLMLDTRGVCASAGSVCRSHEQTPSYVLTSIGLTPDEARNSVRFSFSRMNTESEVKRAVGIVANCVKALKNSIASQLND